CARRAESSSVRGICRVPSLTTARLGPWPPRRFRVSGSSTASSKSNASPARSSRARCSGPSAAASTTSRRCSTAARSARRSCSAGCRRSTRRASSRPRSWPARTSSAACSTRCRELARHLVEHAALDVRAGQLLGRDEARLVERRQPAEQLRLAERAAVEQRLDVVLAAALGPEHRALELRAGDALLLEEAVEDPLTRNRRGGHGPSLAVVRDGTRQIPRTLLDSARLAH